MLSSGRSPNACSAIPLTLAGSSRADGAAIGLADATAWKSNFCAIDLGNAATGVVSDFTGFANNHTMGFKDITSHDLTLGVRWNLYSPPPYEPMPVVRKG